jgi:hypothetical protein
MEAKMENENILPDNLLEENVAADTTTDTTTDTTADTTTDPPVDITAEPADSTKKNRYESMEDELVRYKVALDNTLEDTDLQAGVLRFGYDTARIEEGNTLYSNAENWFYKQKRDYALQYSATQRLTELMQQSEELFVQDRSIARIAFKNNITVFTELNLSGKRPKKAFGQWLHELEHFYTNSAANPGIVVGLEKFNITAETLQDRITKLEAVKNANSYQERLKGNAQRATDRRDIAFKELRNWMIDFFKIARMAFTDDRQQLEKLKIVAKS